MLMKRINLLVALLIMVGSLSWAEKPKTDLMIKIKKMGVPTHRASLSEVQATLKNPELHFKDYQPSYRALVGEEGVFVEANNPYNLPLYFESSNPNVASVDNNGYVKALAPGASEISFYFDGNEEFFGGEGHYMLTVVEELPLEAIFTADKAQVVYYEMGFDSEEEAATWNYTGENTGYFTWHLEENPPYGSQPSFASIDAKSMNSMVIRRGTKAQNEKATSPTITIEPNTTLEFYACFQSVFLVYDDWKLIITDEDSNETLYTLSGFMWSQQNEFTGPAWQKFAIDLKDHASKNVSFTFEYLGPDGEDLAIDGFRLLRAAPEGSITLYEGESAHFIDQSNGNPTSWQWTFEGGRPQTSTEQNPIVYYDVAGVYPVTLTVTDEEGETSTTTVEEYVKVVTQAPKALIGLPTNGYLSPWTAIFIPKDTPVQFRNLSSGNPKTVHWTFEGGTPAESYEHSPVVTYKEEGLYGLTLDVANDAGATSDFMKNAIQVGGSQYVWNIELEEYDKFSDIPLGYFGYYGGTNWLGIEKVAERYDAPPKAADNENALPVKATIDAVQVYFYRTSTVSPDAEITLQLCEEGTDGNPGEVLAETSVKASELAYNQEKVVATDFVFSEPVTIDKPFFVTIGPFPNNSVGGETDDISIMAVRRGKDGKATTWQLLEDEDPVTYERLGTYTWFSNAGDDAASFCITPRLTYIDDESGINDYEMLTTNSTSHDKRLIYDLQGRRLSTSSDSLKRGIYIIGGKKIVLR